MLLQTLFVTGFVPLILAKPLFSRWENVRVKHAWKEVPSGWQDQGPAPTDHEMTMRIGLKQGNLDRLLASLYEVSDPTHSRYGQHLTKEETDALVRPHADTINTVDAWLVHHGISPSSCHRSGAGDWIALNVTVAQAERMLDTKYNVYSHSPSSDAVVRTLSYSLPSVLHDHIDVITPTTYFGTMRSMRKTSFLQPEIAPAPPQADSDSLVRPISAAAVPSSCSSTITPACLRALYNTASYVPAASSTNKLGIAGYLGEYANDADLQTFFKKYRTDAVGTKMTHIQINGGGNNQNDAGTEANLDIQYTEGISYPTPNIYYSTGGSPPFTPDSSTPSNTNEPYLDWLNYVLAQSTIPQTFSTSYGDDEQTVPKDYAISVCNLFAQLGARGSSILFSSGDDGVGAGNCQTNDGTNVRKFQPSFPASCPYVTTVGGTYRVPEVAVSFSGGGFSNYFAQPAYQATAVKNYIAAFGTSYNTLYNASGRAYPDVAAQGNGFAVVIDGVTRSVGGTSASAPTVAGVISLLNDYRISIGKSPLGFLNPLIYSTASSGFNDITSGSNPGCSTNGFTAKTGWDPVTGLGTPDFLKLQTIVRNV